MKKNVTKLIDCNVITVKRDDRDYNEDRLWKNTLHSALMS